MLQELKLSPVLLKAAAFNKGCLLPVLSTFTGLDASTIPLLPNPEWAENSFKVQAAPLLRHCQVLDGTQGCPPCSYHGSRTQLWVPQGGCCGTSGSEGAQSSSEKAKSSTTSSSPSASSSRSARDIPPVRLLCWDPCGTRAPSRPSSAGEGEGGLNPAALGTRQLAAN